MPSKGRIRISKRGEKKSTIGKTKKSGSNPGGSKFKKGASTASKRLSKAGGKVKAKIVKPAKATFKKGKATASRKGKRK